MFPLIYGRTKVLVGQDDVLNLENCIRRTGEGETIPAIEEDDGLKPPKHERMSDIRYDLPEQFSRKFQWLPCKIRFEEDEKKEARLVDVLCIRIMH